jgi:hypothetical protein
VLLLLLLLLLLLELLLLLLLLLQELLLLRRRRRAASRPPRAVVRARRGLPVGSRAALGSWTRGAARPRHLHLYQRLAVVVGASEH